jgi:hypothetical protein
MKRGPKVGPERYFARASDLRVPYDTRLLIERRTEPFLDSVGMSRPLSTVLAECYLQGMKDALEVLGIDKDEAA